MYIYTLCTVPTPFKTLKAPKIKVLVQYLKVHVHIFISSYTAFICIVWDTDTISSLLDTV